MSYYTKVVLVDKIKEQQRCKALKEVLERLLEEFKLAQNMNQQNILVKLELQKARRKLRN